MPNEVFKKEKTILCAVTSIWQFTVYSLGSLKSYWLCVQVKQRERSGTAPFLVRSAGHGWWLHRTAAWLSYPAAVCLGWGQHVSSFRHCREASLVAQPVKNPPAMQKTQVWFLGWEDPLEEGTATHSSIPAWRTAWTEEPGGLQSMGSQNRTWLSD